MKDFSYQGKFWLGDRLATGRPGPLSWVGDAPTLSLKFSLDKSDRTESYSGNRATSASLRKATKGTFDLTLNWALAKNLALGLGGTVIDIPTGTVTGEPFPPGLAVGDTIMLAHRDVSALVLTDSTATPKTLVLDTDYEIESAKGGLMTIKALGTPTYTQPFKGAYSYGKSTNVVAFTTPAIEKYGVMDGINTVDNSSVRVQVYRMQFDPVSEFGLIQDDFGDLKLSGSVLFDVVNASDDEFGGYMLTEFPADD
ncbi:MAG: hypothetical protein WBW32_05940 [Luteibacter sp.]